MKRAILLLSLLISFLLSPAAFSQMKQSKLTKKKVHIPAISMNFNLLGIALYGPTIQMEIRLTDPYCIVPFIRYSYAGVISTYQWTNFESDMEYYPTSIAGGIGFKGYKAVTPRRNWMYYGGFGEFIHEDGLKDIDSKNEYEQIRNAVAVYGNLGYRWNFKRNFFVNLGILPGIAFDIENKGYYAKGASEGLEYKDFQAVSFIGMIDFSFGWRIKRGY